MNPLPHRSPYQYLDASPLSTDAMIIARADALVGPAELRQTWFLPVGHDNRQSPLVVPMGGLPFAPDAPDSPDGRDVLAIARILDSIADEVDAGWFVVVWERPGPHELGHDDIAWARVVASASRASGRPVRAQLLSHSTGVRWLAPDDYL